MFPKLLKNMIIFIFIFNLHEHKALKYVDCYVVITSRKFFCKGIKVFFKFHSEKCVWISCPLQAHLCFCGHIIILIGPRRIKVGWVLVGLGILLMGLVCFCYKRLILFGYIGGPRCLGMIHPTPRRPSHSMRYYHKTLFV